MAYWWTRCWLAVAIWPQEGLSENLIPDRKFAFENAKFRAEIPHPHFRYISGKIEILSTHNPRCRKFVGVCRNSVCRGKLQLLLRLSFLTYDAAAALIREGDIFRADVYRYDVMSQCWCENPPDRPTFERLRHQLETLLSRDVNYLELDDIDTPLATQSQSTDDNDNNDMF